MSRSQQIREVLQGQGDVPLAVIMASIEASEDEEKKVRNIISALRTKGEIENGSAPDTFRAGSVTRPKAEKKKLREIADKAKRTPKTNGSLHALALEQLLATGQLLRATIREQVEVDQCEAIGRALDVHERAEALVRGCG